MGGNIDISVGEAACGGTSEWLAQTLDCSSTDSSWARLAATERRKIDPQSDGRSYTPFVPENL